MHACTIIAKNYLAQARVLARSFLEHHPDGEFSVLIIDELDGTVDPQQEPFTVLSWRDINCEPFARMAARYDVLELSTAVKPWLLRQRLQTGAEAITYLDPDIRVYGSLELLDSEARQHGLVLTPHNTHPIPDDGERPTQIDIMIAGVYNLGYVSIGHGAEIEALLDWWCDRLTRDCRVDPVYGYFVDQRWFDLAPGFVSDYSIIRCPEYNVAYWNSHSRSLTIGDGGYKVDGRPLAFFHFSGFDPAQPTVLSRHQTRVGLADRPALRRICAEYAQETLAEGYEQTRYWPYGYGRLADGTEMTRTLRSIYALGEDDGAITQSPFEPAGCQALLSWAAEQQPGAPPGINRALARAYGSRVDLRTTFPDLAGASRAPFLSWARDRGHQELDLPPELLPAASESEPPPAPAAVEEASVRIQWGLNVVGYFRSELGVGEAARQVVSALDAAAVPLLPVHGDKIPLNRQQHNFRHLDARDGTYPVNLICMNADALPEFAAQVGPGFFRDRYSIGLWFWEVTTPPAQGWRDSFAALDEVWVPTRHVAEAVSQISPVPVVQVRLPVEMPRTSPVSRRLLGLSDGYVFLFSFDYLSVFERKNPLAVVDAFASAFDPDEGAVLVIKCINQDHDPANHARLLEAVAPRPDIRVIDRYLQSYVKDALTATCDCYISLHRSEGLGLTMAEAMYLGKPVIATGYSGNLDFMSPENSYLVDYEMMPIGNLAPPYPPHGEWADPDVAHAAALMREVFDDREASAARGKAAAESIRQTHSTAAAAESMTPRLAWLRENRQSVDRRPSATGLAPLVAVGPTPPPRSAAGPIGPAVRRVALRLMKPLSAYQKTVNEAMVRSLDTLHDQGLRLAGAQQRTEAADMAQAREIGRQAASLRYDVDALDATRMEIVARLDGISRDQQQSQAEGRALPFMAGNPLDITDVPVAGRVLGYEVSASANGDVYKSFEDVFRGSESFIRDRQRAFLPLIGDRRPVLDFGCGRGEFLDLMRERGISCTGIDSDPGMIARCREKGHEQVVLGDGVAYLSELEPGSLGAIFCAQVIEHLPYETLLQFLALARRALAPDGVLIAETVNPHSPAALKTFWVDLTHQHPIFPEVALALCRSAGFEKAFVFHPNGIGDVEVDRYTTGEYAVVAGTTIMPGDLGEETGAAERAEDVTA